MNARSRAALMAYPLLLAVGLAACGGSGAGASNGVAGRSPDQIVKATTRAAETARSVEAAGSMTEDGTRVALDLRMVAGVGASGWLSESGRRFNLVLDGRTLYINAGVAFWKTAANAAAASVLAGRWLRTPATGAYAAVARIAGLRTFFRQVFGRHGRLAKTGIRTLHGVRVIGLRDTTRGGVLYVATTGRPYPIELSGDTGSGSGRLDFSGYGRSFAIAPPKRSVSLMALEQAG